MPEFDAWAVSDHACMAGQKRLVAERARLDEVVAESARSGRRLLSDLRFGPAAALDPSLLEHRALRLTGDRVRAVEEALGEIVVYLEFELRNHPRIPDCTAFLEAIQPLRAMLAR